MAAGAIAVFQFSEPVFSAEEVAQVRAVERMLHPLAHNDAAVVAPHQFLHADEFNAYPRYYTTQVRASKLLAFNLIVLLIWL